ncbi:MAG: single-stranded DNA-binding protein [Methylophilus sp.]|uniref:single-stranded DNA-binding protein n=1 Tax=Methylophilus sp. TaxID=29541 RepID=UPI003F9FD6BA
MSQSNDVNLSGFVMTEPKMKEGSERSICTFFLETCKTWTEEKPGGKDKVRKEHFDQHCIVALDRTALALVKLAKIGSEISVKGELTYSRTTDASQKEWVRAEIVISSFQIHGLRKYRYDATVNPGAEMPYSGSREG